MSSRRVRGLPSVNRTRIDPDPPDALRPFHMEEIIHEKEWELAQLQGFSAVDELLQERNNQLSGEQEKYRELSDRFSKLGQDYKYNLSLLDERDHIISRLRQELVKTQTEAKALRGEVSQLHDQTKTVLAEGERHLDKLNAAQLELEGHKVSSSEHMARLRADMQQLEGKYEALLREARSAADDAQLEAAAAGEELEARAAEASSLKDLLEETETRLERSESQRKAATSTLREADLRIQQLQHELERQRTEAASESEKQLKRDVLAVKKYYTEKMDKMRTELVEDYEAKYAKVVEGVKGMEGMLNDQKHKQAERLAAAEAESRRWREETDRVLGQMRQMERSIQQLRDERARVVMEAEAVRDAMEISTTKLSMEEGRSELQEQVSSGLHKELKDKLQQSLEARHAAEAKSRELQAQVDRLSLEAEKLRLRSKEGGEELANARARLQQEDVLRRRAEEASRHLARQLPRGILMARLAEAYLKTAASASKARALLASGRDPDEIADEAVSISKVKETAKKCRHHMQELLPPGGVYSDDQQARELASDTKTVENEIARIAATHASAGVFGTDVQDKYKKVRRRLERSDHQVERLTRLLKLHGISSTPPEPHGHSKSGAPDASRWQRRAGTSTSDDGEGDYNVPEPTTTRHIPFSQGLNSLEAILSAAHSASAHRAAAEAEARQVGLELEGSAGTALDPQRLANLMAVVPISAPATDDEDTIRYASPVIRGGPKSNRAYRPHDGMPQYTQAGAVGYGDPFDDTEDDVVAGGLRSPRRWAEHELEASTAVRYAGSGSHTERSTRAEGSKASGNTARRVTTRRARGSSAVTGSEKGQRGSPHRVRR